MPLKNLLENIKPIKVGPRGFINLISLSPQLVNATDPLGAERLIVSAARVSYSGLKINAGTSNASASNADASNADVSNTNADALNADVSNAKDVGLIRFMLEHGHTSPFEHVYLTFCVRAPIFVVRQWFRHRTGHYNEISGRYAELKEEVWTLAAEDMRGQSTSNRQCSEGLITGAAAETAHAALERAMEAAFAAYHTALEAGISREIARCALPLATYTEFYFSMDLHNLLNFLRLRMAPDAQPEIRAYADAIASYVKALFPHTWKAFEDFTLNSVRFSAPELAVLRNTTLVSADAADAADAAKQLSGSKRAREEFKGKIKKISKLRRPTAAGTAADDGTAAATAAATAASAANVVDGTATDAI